jgi:2-amino-4-hydroxy-6-hydroxymethyldihydropteridine diphosphokinase
MNKAYLLIGGNMGDRNKNLNEAIDFIARECGSVIKSSSIYETAAWGKTDQPDFLNQCLLIQTSLSAPDLMKQLLKIEEKMGRKRKEKNDPRIIDIDILFFNDEVLQTEFLTLPHPQIQNRRFALVPLKEIAPNLVHPVFKKSMSKLLDECPDKLEVKKLR